MKSPDEIKKGLEYLATRDPAKKAELWETGIAYDWQEDAAGDALAYIQQLEARVPRWIPVEERLPEEKQRVLIFWFDHIFEATYLWDGNFETLNRELLLAGRDFTHWMPLPEPPKEVQHE